MSDCKNTRCHNETDGHSAYCFDCMNRESEDTQHRTNDNTAPCTACGAAITKLETFTRGECLTCHRARVDGKPLPSAHDMRKEWAGTVTK